MNEKETKQLLKKVLAGKSTKKEISTALKLAKEEIKEWQDFKILCEKLL